MTSKMESLIAKKEQLTRELDLALEAIRKEAEESVCRFIADIWENGARSFNKKYLRLADIEALMTDSVAKMLDEAVGCSRYSTIAKLGMVVMKVKDESFYHDGKALVIRRSDGSGFPTIRVDKIQL